MFIPMVNKIITILWQVFFYLDLRTKTQYFASHDILIAVLPERLTVTLIFWKVSSTKYNWGSKHRTP